LARIESETSKARDLIDQLQAFSRNKSVKAGKMDLSDCVEVLGADMAVLVEPKITFIADIRISEAFVYSTHEYIYQAVKNLCVNGFESLGGRAGKVILALKDMDLNLFGLRRYIITDEAPDRMKSSSVRMKAGQGGKHYLMTGFLVKGRSYIQISVSDTGRGITPDILPNIFDPFFTTKAVHKGTGLGLSTVQGTVINAGGAIIVETAPEQGTTIHLFLPRYTVLDDATAGLAA
jgi:signal transduction histidine kinase